MIISPDRVIIARQILGYQFLPNGGYYIIHRNYWNDGIESYGRTFTDVNGNEHKMADQPTCPPINRYVMAPKVEMKCTS